MKLNIRNIRTQYEYPYHEIVRNSNIDSHDRGIIITSLEDEPLFGVDYLNRQIYAQITKICEFKMTKTEANELVLYIFNRYYNIDINKYKVICWGLGCK